ncbi:MAG TPA: hypothetical protein DEP84_36850 [Chloroflexi bacterium]|nr:hypothetical protein [Chloroflexota bacterium]
MVNVDVRDALDERVPETVHKTDVRNVGRFVVDRPPVLWIRGEHVQIMIFAVDQQNRTGFGIRFSADGVGLPIARLGAVTTGTDTGEQNNERICRCRERGFDNGEYPSCAIALQGLQVDVVIGGARTTVHGDDLPVRIRLAIQVGCKVHRIFSLITPHHPDVPVEGDNRCDVVGAQTRRAGDGQRERGPPITRVAVVAVIDHHLLVLHIRHPKLAGRVFVQDQRL